MRVLLLDTSEFFDSAAWAALLGVIVALLFIAVIDLNYRFFAKTVLDFLLAAAAFAITSPVYAVCAIIARKRTGKVLESKAYLGGKGKIIYIHSFAGMSRKIKDLPRLLDIMRGAIAFVGVKPLSVSDGALTDDKYMGRFAAKPGLINHLAIGGYEELTYEESFELDARYAKKRELFRDIWTMVLALVYRVRGEKRAYMGETRDNSYAEILLKRSEITSGDIARAEEYAQNALEELKKAENFRREKRG